MMGVTLANDPYKHWKLGRPSHVAGGHGSGTAVDRSWDQHGSWATDLRGICCGPDGRWVTWEPGLKVRARVVGGLWSLGELVIGHGSQAPVCPFARAFEPIDSWRIPQDINLQSSKKEAC